MFKLQMIGPNLPKKKTDTDNHCTSLTKIEKQTDHITISQSFNSSSNEDMNMNKRKPFKKQLNVIYKPRLNIDMHPYGHLKKPEI